MKAIFKIIEYLPETTQIVVRFARLHAPQSIEKYNKVAINYSELDCYDSESFVKSLMRRCGNHMVKLQEEKEPINNVCLLYTSPSPRDRTRSRMPSSA